MFPYFSVLLGNYLALLRRNVSTKTPYVYPEIVLKDILGGAGSSLKICCQKYDDIYIFFTFHIWVLRMNRWVSGSFLGTSWVTQNTLPSRTEFQSCL